jgi:hypothetical protein
MMQEQRERLLELGMTIIEYKILDDGGFRCIIGDLIDNFSSGYGDNELIAFNQAFNKLNKTKEND